MRSSIISWFVTLIILNFACNKFSHAKKLKKLNYVVIVGTVYCDTSIQDDISKAKRFISGASIVVGCESSKPIFRQETKTNENGEFKVRLPFLTTKRARQIKGCSVKLLKSSEPFCAKASLKTSTSFHFESSKQGSRIFSAGLFTFKPSKTSKLSKGGFIGDKTMSGNVIQGIPLVPSLPTVFGFPFPPNPLQPPSIFPPIPNPFQPPSIFPPIPIPIPFQPPSIFPPFPNPLQPPPSIFPPIPNPFQPPPSIFPPIPILIPSPPPPVFPIPLPPNPFQPPPSVFPPIPFPPLIPGIIPSPPPPPPPAFPFPLPPGFPGFPPPSKKISP